MARRSDHTKKELKTLIIDAGHNLIKTWGYRKFSVRGVAAEIGYTVGTVYNQFNTYDNLVLHINAKTLDIWYDEMQTMINKSKNSVTIYDIAKFYIDFSSKHYNEWLALFEFTTGPNTKIPEFYIKKMKRFFDIVEQLVKPIVNNDSKKARRTARVLWAGIHGICILSLTNKLDLVKAESPYILARSFIESYLLGLKDLKQEHL